MIEVSRSDAEHLLNEALRFGIPGRRIQAESWPNPPQEIVMSNLKIEIYERAEPDPATTVTIPGPVLKFASRFMPKDIKSDLQAEGIDLEALLKLSDETGYTGMLLEVDQAKQRRKVVLSLV